MIVKIIKNIESPYKEMALSNQVKQGNEEAIKEVGRRLLKPAAFQIRSSHPRDLDEFFDVCSWVWKHFNTISGIAFLPHDKTVYQQAPYQEITEEEYNELLAKMPEFDWEGLAQFEHEDMTTGSQELACTAAGGCEL